MGYISCDGIYIYIYCNIYIYISHRILVYSHILLVAYPHNGGLTNHLNQDKENPLKRTKSQVAAKLKATEGSCTDGVGVKVFFPPGG